MPGRLGSGREAGPVASPLVARGFGGAALNGHELVAVRPVSIDLVQVTNPHNRSVPGPNSPTLTAGSQIITFNSWQDPCSSEGGAAPLATGDQSSLLGWDGRPRTFTPLEKERLMGVPDGWTEGYSKTARGRMLGNGVVRHVAEWIGRRLKKAIEEG